MTWQVTKKWRDDARPPFWQATISNGKVAVAIRDQFRLHWNDPYHLIETASDEQLAAYAEMILHCKQLQAQPVLIVGAE